LHDAGIASFCHNVANVELPFALNARASFFKFFMRDTGLLSSMSMGNAQSAILNGDLSINEGAIVENCIADLLVKRGYPLFYWDIKGRLEVDFLIQKENTIVPIEVKSGRDYRRHASLDRLMATSSRHEKRALVLSPYNVEVAEQIDYLPLYMVMFL
jgi:predicted AAA+ superfamily ATPase